MSLGTDHLCDRGTRGGGSLRKVLGSIVASAEARLRLLNSAAAQASRPAAVNSAATVAPTIAARRSTGFRAIAGIAENPHGRSVLSCTAEVRLALWHEN